MTRLVEGMSRRREYLFRGRGGGSTWCETSFKGWICTQRHRRKGSLLTSPGILQQSLVGHCRILRYVHTEYARQGGKRGLRRTRSALLHCRFTLFFSVSFVMDTHLLEKLIPRSPEDREVTHALVWCALMSHKYLLP